MSAWWFVTVLALLDALLWGLVFRMGQPSKADRRLWIYTARGPTSSRRSSPGSRIGRSILWSLTTFLDRLTSPSRRRRQADRLLWAGLDWDPGLFDGLKLFAALVGLGASALAGHLGMLPGSTLGWAAVAGGAGYLLPVIWVNHRAVTRARAFQQALPDALDVFVICLRAGLSLQAAVAEYARDAAGVAGEAFRRYLSDLALGAIPEDAMAEMVRRYPGDDLAVVSASLLQGTRLGSPLAAVLEEQAAHFRSLALSRAEEGARKLSTRLVLPLVAFIFPQVFIIGLGPVVLRLLGPGGLLR